MFTKLRDINVFLLLLKFLEFMFFLGMINVKTPLKASN
jgi:hypothetical protein